MSWKYHIRKELKKEKSVFIDMIKNFSCLGSVIFKERNTLRKIEDPALGAIAAKSFKIPHIFNQYIYTNLRKSKASRSYYHAETLLSKGINTPKPLAYFEEKLNGKLYRSFYFSEFYSYDFTFRELIEDRNSFSDWNLILKAFTEFVFKMHESSILFKDLSPGNVLIKKIGNSYDFALIDLNRMSFKYLSLDKRLENFIRLSLTDEMIPIITKRYAELSNQNGDSLLKILTSKNQKYIRRKERKKNIKKLLGKN